MSLIFGDKAEELNILQLHENLKNENAQDQILINELESKVQLLEETVLYVMN